VRIAVDPGETRVYDGSSARASIVVDSAKNAVLVPTSAVHVSGAQATVQVLHDGTQAQTVPVTLGAMGTTQTQILSGVSEGDQVVLADLSVSLSSLTGTATNNNSTGLLGNTGTGAKRIYQGGPLPDGGFVTRGNG
jgi:HlyD family secretion protein